MGTAPARGLGGLSPSTRPYEQRYSERRVFNEDARADFEAYGPPQRNALMIPFLATNASQLIIPANYRRTMVIVQNLEAAGGLNLFVAFGTDASATNGFRVVPGGDFFSDYSALTDDVYVFFDAPGTFHRGIALQQVLS